MKALLDLASICKQWQSPVSWLLLVLFTVSVSQEHPGKQIQRQAEGDTAGGAPRWFSFRGKWIKYKILPGSDGRGQLNPVTENLEALPFFISLHELLPVVIKTPMFLSMSLHLRRLTVIWIFVPVWGSWVLFWPHLTDKEREVCDIKWFAQVT